LGLKKRKNYKKSKKKVKKMQFSCSLFLRQWYHTRHESFVLQTPRYISQQLLVLPMRFIPDNA